MAFIEPMHRNNPNITYLLELKMKKNCCCAINGLDLQLELYIQISFYSQKMKYSMQFFILFNGLHVFNILMLRLSNSSVLPVELTLVSIKLSHWCDEIEWNGTSCRLRVEIHSLPFCCDWTCLGGGGGGGGDKGKGLGGVLNSTADILWLGVGDWTTVSGGGSCSDFLVLVMRAARASVCQLKASLSFSLLLGFDWLDTSGARILQNGEHID